MMPKPESFVVFPLGEKRFALRAESVAELARPGRLQEFPHTTGMLSGVLVRRGRIVPVCDIAPMLIGPGAPARRFYIIATRNNGNDAEWTAVPVSGECELATGQWTRPAPTSAAYVVGVLARNGEQVPVIDLEKLLMMEVQ